MALSEMFQGDAQFEKDRIRNVLNNGLEVAEGKGEVLSSGADDLVILFTQHGLHTPRFLARCTPEFREIYNGWLDENRARVDAVVNPKGSTANVAWEI